MTVVANQCLLLGLEATYHSHRKMNSSSVRVVLGTGSCCSNFIVELEHNVSVDRHLSIRALVLREDCCDAWIIRFAEKIGGGDGWGGTKCIQGECQYEVNAYADFLVLFFVVCWSYG